MSASPEKTTPLEIEVEHADPAVRPGEAEVEPAARTDWRAGSAIRQGQDIVANALNVRRAAASAKLSIAGERLSASDQAIRRRNLRYAFFAVLALAPTWIVGGYGAMLSSDRYVSTASFVVRTASKPTGSSNLGAILQMVGLSRSDDDVFAVQDFLRSREAIEKLERHMPLREYYANSSRDFMLHFPSFLYKEASEEFYRYMRNFIDVSYNNGNSITTLTVQAFDPRQAYDVTTALLAAAEERVNDLNSRLLLDAVKVAQQEVDRSRERLAIALTALTDFRNRQMMLDPSKSSLMLSELIGHLGSDLAQTQAKTTELKATSPDDPALSELQRRSSALEQQIQRERQKIGGDDAGLADSLLKYERLTLDGDYAKTALDRALNALETARVEARRQQLFLGIVVNPNLPDSATMPRRTWLLLTTLSLNLTALMVGWLLATGLREHTSFSD